MTIGNFIKITGLDDQFDKDELDLELTQKDCVEVLESVMNEWIGNCMSDADGEKVKKMNLHLKYNYDQKFDTYAESCMNEI